MPRPVNPDAPPCPACGHEHMHSNGDRWRCPDCGKQKSKSGKQHGGHRCGKQGGTPAAERIRKSRQRTGKTGNEARDAKRRKKDKDQE